MLVQDEFQAFFFASVLIVILSLKIVRTLLSIVGRSFY